MNKDTPIVVAYGGGTNSTAMLCGFRERNITPSLIIFADTGGELPHTYEHIKLMSDKCQEWWGIEIQMVRALFKGEYESLEASCIRKKTLPSLAFGFKACSIKHKVVPQDSFVKKWMDEQDLKKIIRAIGYDSGESHRGHATIINNLKKGRSESFWYPLIEWQWRRQHCIEAIKRHGLTQPGKSSCFFCPAMKKHEIVRLKEEYPEHYERAIRMEQGLKVQGRVRGLYMGVPWSEIIEADAKQDNFLTLLEDGAERHIPCGCYDG